MIVLPRGFSGSEWIPALTHATGQHDHGICNPVRLAAQTLPDRRDDDPPRRRGDAFRQMDLPLALVFVHAEHDGGVGRRMVDGRLQEQEIRAELGHRERRSIDQQTHFYIGGMPRVTG